MQAAAAPTRADQPRAAGAPRPPPPRRPADTGLVLPRVSTRFGASDDRTGWLNPVVVSPDAVRLDQAEMVTLGAGEGEDVYLW